MWGTPLGSGKMDKKPSFRQNRGEVCQVVTSSFTFFFFFIRFMNMKQKGIPKNTKGKAKGKEGVIVKRDRELEKKRKLFNDLLQRLDQNSNSVMETDSE